MSKKLNPLIEETLAEIIHDANMRKFILDILEIESSSIYAKNKEYEATLTKAVRNHKK